MNATLFGAPMRLARDAPGAILPPLIIGLVLVVGGSAAHVAIGQVMSRSGSDFLLFVLAAPGVLLVVWSLFLVWFFRDPERTPEDGLVSPADGRVLFVEAASDDSVGPGLRIAVFMSPLNVHVNRVPAAARLVTSQHLPGGYLPAFRKESERNERLITVWEATGDDTPGGAERGDRIKLVQIAGALAKRIVPWVRPGAQLARGERFGMIKLGSRVDVHLPRGYQAAVRPGQRVAAGRTTLARRHS